MGAQLVYTIRLHLSQILFLLTCRTWTAAWKAPGAATVDMNSYASKSAGKSVPNILQNVKSQL